MTNIIGSIQDVAFGGDGVARCDGKVVFVPGTIQGEKVEIRVTAEAKNFSRGVPERIIEPSPDRTEPDCPYYMTPGSDQLYCNGCCYRHMTYEQEITVKAKQLRDLLTRIAGISDLPEISITPAPSFEKYRNKIVLHTDGESKLGYFGQDNKTLVDIAECKLAAPHITQQINEFRAGSDFANVIRQSSHITFRWTDQDGAMFWPGKIDPALRLTENSAFGPITTPRSSFAQVNTEAAKLLVSAVQEILKTDLPDVFIDLYSGAGLFAIAAALTGVETVFGVELDSASVECAMENGQNHCPGKATFICAPVAKGLKIIKSAVGTLDKAALLLDPPRKGLEPPLLRILSESSPASLIYVSCAPDTLARDIKILGRSGYSLKSVHMIDMFPRTAFFETISVLKKNP